MMRFDPSLLVERMAVERGGAAVYDERFHEGVNVIRGANSSGKSTVLNLLFYGLGGDLSDWSEHALLCDRVTIGLVINGSPLTVSRAIAQRRGQPMDVFFGNFESALRAPMAQWHRHPYARSASSESFSQALFRLLGMPEVAATDDGGNVTMHQLLRLLYADQLSPVESLFKFEQFDPPTLRDAIGRLLCGAFEPQLYTNELRLKELEKQHASVSARLTSLFSVLQSEKHDYSSAWVEQERRTLDGKRQEIEAQIEAAERELYTSDVDDQITLDAQAKAYDEVRRLQDTVAKGREELGALSFDIADSSAFIAELERKVAALEEANAMVEPIGDVHFHWCPSCYAPLSEPEAHTCYLCRQPFDTEEGRARFARLIADTALQLKESRLLQDRRRARATEVEREIDQATVAWQQATQRYQALRSLPSSEKRARLRALQREAGYLDRQIEDLDKKASMVTLVEELSEQKASLATEMERLKSANQGLRAAQKQHWDTAYSTIANEIRELLRNDLRRQDSFENPERIDFDFAANRISVDGKSYFSASSRVILKSSFCLALLAAATKHSFMRHPRFCMIDTIEDKGMEVERSHNFQRQIARVSAEAQVQHQIIYATAMIAPELESGAHVVGSRSTRDEPTLRLG